MPFRDFRWKTLAAAWASAESESYRLKKFFHKIFAGLNFCAILVWCKFFNFDHKMHCFSLKKNKEMNSLSNQIIFTVLAKPEKANILLHAMCLEKKTQNPFMEEEGF